MLINPDDLRPYDPANWYWFVGGDEARAYSSAVSAYVDADDAALLAWLSDGGVVTRTPDEAELDATLAAHSVVGPSGTNLALNRFQFEAMMRILGVTDAGVEAAIDQAITDPAENAVAKARYYRAESYNRSHPLFALLGPIVGLTTAQIDTAWATAQAIR